MNSFNNPDAVHQPLGKYHHSVAVPANAEWLVISGQVGAARDGTMASGVGAQTEQALRNILACLEANGMSKADLVKVTIYLTDARFIGEYRAARSNVLGDDTLPASTLVIVAGLATPDILVEVEAWAARAKSA
jgi:2-iminobutanoate/2-iminopropanoate deaminase